MKIAIFTDTFLPHVNGVVTHIAETIKIFAKHKHKVLIIAPHSEKIIDKLNIKGVEIKYISGLPALFYPDFKVTNPLNLEALKAVKKFNPDIIHFHTPFTIGFNAVMVSRYLKKPVVSTFHTYFMEPEYLRIVGFDRFNLDNSKLINELGWQFARFFHDQSDVIIVPSEFTKNDLIKHSFTKPIIKISNGITLPVKQKVSIAYPFDQYFLYVGRLSKEKSLDVLINSFVLFASDNKKTHLVIVGDGPDKNNLEQLVIKADLKDRVHFLGAIPHKTLLKSNIFSDALAFVSPSTSEVQGLSVLEAFSYGLPIVTIKSRAMTELVKNNGILCEPNNIDSFAKALKLVASNQNMQKKFSRESLKIAKEHLLEDSVKQLEKVYLSLI